MKTCLGTLSISTPKDSCKQYKHSVYREWQFNYHFTIRCLSLSTVEKMSHAEEKSTYFLSIADTNLLPKKKISRAPPVTGMNFDFPSTVPELQNKPHRIAFS